MVDYLKDLEGSQPKWNWQFLSLSCDWIAHTSVLFAFPVLKALVGAWKFNMSTFKELLVFLASFSSIHPIIICSTCPSWVGLGFTSIPRQERCIWEIPAVIVLYTSVCWCMCSWFLCHTHLYADVCVHDCCTVHICMPTYVCDLRFYAQNRRIYMNTEPQNLHWAIGFAFNADFRCL